MIFRSLKLAGFKSFAEAAQVDIENGLTGIVGPNGCGKSNIVEALRWVMGESSARQMRGGEMDDAMKNMQMLMKKLRNVYTENSAITELELNNMLTHDLWLDAQTCRRLKLVDEIL